ncbi:MAG: molybdenum cofactor guanylyltransferase [Candidatus Methanofastidiosa archaeon]|nr:molybdenum cofactor guanylyltransferase [Candidatus Methanofastidiosa archaeon]
MTKMDISIAILCGGRSRRFGTDKTLFEYKGKPLYRHLYDKLSKLSDDIFIQCGKKDSSLYGVKCHNDDYLDLGPIGGIYSALKSSRHNRTFVVGCDMPNIEASFVELLSSYDADIVVPVWENGYYEPLSAVYSKKIVPYLEYNIVTGNLKISQIFEENDVKKISIESLISQGLIDKFTFKNVNRPDDI